MTTNESTSMEIMRQEVSEVKRDLSEMKNKVNEMYHSLIGNTLAKDGGIIKRLQTVEEKHEELTDRVEDLEKKNDKLEVYQKILWAAGGFVASSLFVYVLQLIFKH